MDRVAKEQGAARRARAVLQRYLTPPSVVAYPGIPLVAHPPSAAPGTSAAVTSTDVLIVSSPYPRRRATLALLPHDTPVNDEWHLSREEEEKYHSGEYVLFVRPDALPTVDGEKTERHGSDCTQTSAAGNGSSAAAEGSQQHVPTTAFGVAEEDNQLVKVPTVRPPLLLDGCRRIPRAPTSPYHRLSYIFGDACCPFTGLFATLRAAGFTRVEGRQGLLHKTASLLWLKHLMPSTVDQLMRQLTQYRKVNHFPGTHWLGRKDKLCLLMRRAQQRWQTRSQTDDGKDSEHGVGALSKSPVGLVKTDAFSPEDSGREPGTQADMDWSALTPQTWLLPQDSKDFQQTLRQRCTAHATSPATSGLFIVKPANNAGGQGIFLINADNDGSGVAAAEAALVKAGALPKLGASAMPATATSCLTKDKVGDEDGDGAAQSRHCFVVQRYLSNPFLILGHKFDLRLYVVVTSYEPVRVYLYREGLVRIATLPYRTSSFCSDGSADTLADVQQLRAHLTNFTVNKRPLTNAEHFKKLEEDESTRARGGTTAAEGTATPTMEPKWPLQALGVYMKDLGYDWAGTQQRIHELLRMTFLAVSPEVRAELHAATRRVADRADDTGDRGDRRDRCKRSASPPSTEGTSATASLSPPPPPCTANGIGPFFELFGVDVLLVHDADSNPPSSLDDPFTSMTGAAAGQTLRPVLLEVNILPSLSTHYSLFDQRIKANFIADALTLVGLTSPLFRAAAAPVAVSGMSSSDAAGQRETAGTTWKAEDWVAQTFPSDLHAREACYTADEERRRAPNFTPLLPTPDSAKRYAPLMVDESLGVVAPSRYDAVLSSWAAARATPATVQTDQAETERPGL
jgi:hypothetical protein